MTLRKIVGWALLTTGAVALLYSVVVTLALLAVASAPVLMVGMHLADLAAPVDRD